MASELTQNYPELRSVMHKMDKLRIEAGLAPISGLVYPAAFRTAEEDKNRLLELTKTINTQAALAVISSGIFNIMKGFGLSIDAALGHSFGELTALWASGSLSEDGYLKLAIERAKAMGNIPADVSDCGMMLATSLGVSELNNILKDFSDLVVANHNSPTQELSQVLVNKLKNLRNFSV